MKLDVTQEIIGYDWDPAVDSLGGHLSVRWAIGHALNTPIPDLPWDAQRIVTCGLLAKEVYENDTVDLTRDQRDMILDRAARAGQMPNGTIAPVHGPMVYLFLRDLFTEPALVAVPEADNG